MSDQYLHQLIDMIAVEFSRKNCLAILVCPCGYSLMGLPNAGKCTLGDQMTALATAQDRINRVLDDLAQARGVPVDDLRAELKFKTAKLGEVVLGGSLMQIESGESPPPEDA